MKRETLMSIYKEALIDVINNLPNPKKNKFSTDFYLTYIMRILFYGEFWNTFYYPDCDRSTIRKKFYVWRDLGIFDKALKIVSDKYNEHRTFKVLYIDATNRQNKNCSDSKLL